MWKGISDILLVEDIPETVEGLELDLASRGGSVFRVLDAVTARAWLAEEKYSVILYDLRIPEDARDEPRLEVGLELIRSVVSSESNRNHSTPFAIVSMQKVVSEVDEFREYPQFLGSFSKDEDSRRLFRVLEGRGLLKSNVLYDGPVREVRRRVKFLVHRVDLSGQRVVATVPTWGSEEFAIELSRFRPSLRSRILKDDLPVFVYGYANVAADSATELTPRDFEQIVEPVPPVRLNAEGSA